VKGRRTKEPARNRLQEHPRRCSANAVEEKRVGNVEGPSNQNAGRYCFQQRSLFVPEQSCSTAHPMSIPHPATPVGTAYHHKGKGMMRSDEELVFDKQMGV
jgi:hypothetical protein